MKYNAVAEGRFMVQLFPGVKTLPTVIVVYVLRMIILILVQQLLFFVLT